jgi:hypothetical protein
MKLKSCGGAQLLAVALSFHNVQLHTEVINALSCVMKVDSNNLEELEAFNEILTMIQEAGGVNSCKNSCMKLICMHIFL